MNELKAELCVPSSNFEWFIKCDLVYVSDGSKLKSWNLGGKIGDQRNLEETLDVSRRLLLDMVHIGIHEK